MTKSKQKAKLSEKAVVAALNISRWTAHRIDKTATSEVNAKHKAQSDAGRYNKMLVAKVHFAKINDVFNEARALHWRMTQPWGDNGSRILSNELYVDYATQMRKLKNKFDEAADKFVKEYPRMVEGARQRLGTLFRKEDYPDQSRIRKKFEFDLTVMPCPDEDDFRIELSEVHAKEIREDLASKMETATSVAMRDAGQRAMTVVEHMIARLSEYKPSTDVGEAEGVFRDSLVNNIRDLVQLLPAFNLAGDDRLDEITERLRKELCAHDASALRIDDQAREATVKSAESILKQVKQFMA